MGRIRQATLDDKPGIIAVAKMSPYTKGVSNPMFMSDDSFEKGWVAVATTKKDKVVGFVCVRHCSRNPYTSLYYVGTDPRYQGKGIGSLLVSWVLEHSPWQCVRLICEKSNQPSIDWYKRRGFTITGDGANKSGEPYWVLECTLEQFCA